MLRADRNARFVKQPWSIAGLFVGRFAFASGKRLFQPRWKPSRIDSLMRLQQDQPVGVMRVEGRTWWAYRDCFYWEDDDLTDRDVLALLAERDLRKRRKLDRAHALLRADGAAPRREGIPREVKRLVWERYGGHCAECGGDQLLEFDHIIPLAMGGSSTERNLQLLCADCNGAKSDAL